MRERDIIDAHVHLYRSREKEKQAHPIPGRRDCDRWGNAETVIAYMDREGVSHIVVLNFYPTGLMRPIIERRVGGGPGDPLVARSVQAQLVAGLRRQNEWLCTLSKDNPRIVAGIGVQKLLTAAELVEEVELRAAQGARTVKLLPGWFHEYPDDPAFWPMYERCAELGLPVTADTGSIGMGRHIAHPDEDNRICYGQPINFARVLESFPRLTLVMAHLPSAFWDERVDLAGRFPNLMFDISGGFGAPDLRVRDGRRAMAEEDAVRIMRRIGMDRIMFGSDGPHVMIQPYLEQVLRLDMTDAELDMILSGNARRIYRVAQDAD